MSPDSFYKEEFSDLKKQMEDFQKDAIKVFDRAVLRSCIKVLKNKQQEFISMLEKEEAYSHWSSDEKAILRKCVKWAKEYFLQD